LLARRWPTRTCRRDRTLAIRDTARAVQYPRPAISAVPGSFTGTPRYPDASRRCNRLGYRSGNRSPGCPLRRCPGTFAVREGESVRLGVDGGARRAHSRHCRRDGRSRSRRLPHARWQPPEFLPATSPAPGRPLVARERGAKGNVSVRVRVSPLRSADDPAPLMVHWLLPTLRAVERQADREARAGVVHRYSTFRGSL